MVTAIIIFEVGSLLCGVSQNVDQLIAGRTVSGVGAAGICESVSFHLTHLTGILSVISMLQIVSQVTRLEDRPRLFGLFGASFGMYKHILYHFRKNADSTRSSIIGPLIGGAFTDHVRCVTLVISAGTLTRLDHLAVVLFCES
jgi:MFS family permease